MSECILHTGQQKCFDQDGNTVTCDDSGQSGELEYTHSNVSPRMSMVMENLVQDNVTGLIWPADGGLVDFPLNWEESLQWIREQNESCLFGRNDWRMPNRRELRSIINHRFKRPALVEKEYFRRVTPDWYWTSTTSAIATDYAWYLHFDGGRMFYGRKTEYHWVWPVCSYSPVLPRTGQDTAFSDSGGDDGALRLGVQWPEPRFVEVAEGIKDLLTGLIWLPKAGLFEQTMSWQEALDAVKQYTAETGLKYRMPTINEMESLVDASQHSPALPATHPFTDVQEAYWTTTTSGFEQDWSYVLYMHKGAVGVGYKTNRDFHVWPVISR